MSKEPSVHEANNLIRVLKGERRKYTARLHYADGRILEWQTEEHPTMHWSDAARSLVVSADGYGSHVVCQFPEGGVLLVEENPKV